MPARFALLLLLLAGAAPAGAQRPDRAEAALLHRQLKADFQACRHESMALSPYRNYDPHRDLLRELHAMLNAPADACPDTPGRAVAFLRAAVGEPIRADADLALLQMLEGAVRAGKDGPADAGFADALARHHWLVGGEREVPGRTEAELRVWLAAPEAVEALEARIAAAPTARAIWLRSDLLLDRSRADYGPARAAGLLEASPDIHREDVRMRLAALLSEGIHLPPEYSRAARHLRDQATGISDREAAQRALLAIGRRAAAAARTQDERLGALGILAAASLDGLGDSRARHDKMLARIRTQTDRSPLPADRLEWLELELDFAIAYMLDMLPEDTPAGVRPILFDGLIGPDGRLVTYRLVQSSGIVARDHAVRSAFLRRGAEVDLSPVARGRTIWVRLPPVDPMFDYAAAYDRRRAHCPLCS